MRWVIVRNALALVVIAASAALAGPFGRRRDKADPPPEEPPPAEAPAPPEETAPPAPPLFPDGVPVTLDAVPEGLASLSAQACAACHLAAHEAWREGPHARTALTPAFRAAVERAGGSPACRACHLPLTGQHPDLAVGYFDGDVARPDLRPNPAWDPTLMAEGVTCAACHVREGTVLGPRPVTGAPHPVAVSEELSGPAACAPCHELTWPGADRPIYDTVGEWQASAWAEAGVRCQDCHMPPRAGPATASRFAAVADHRFTADPDRALSILVDLDGDDVQRGQPWTVRLTLQNTGAGHHVPTGSPFKRWRLRAVLLDAEDRPLVEPFTHDLAREVEDAPPWRTTADTRIPAGGQVELETSFTVSQRRPAGPATLEIALLRVVEGAEPVPLTTRRVPVEVR